MHGKEAYFRYHSYVNDVHFRYHSYKFWLLLRSENQNKFWVTFS